MFEDVVPERWIQDEHRVGLQKVEELPLWRIVIAKGPDAGDVQDIFFELGGFFFYAIADGRNMVKREESRGTLHKRVGISIGSCYFARRLKGATRRCSVAMIALPDSLDFILESYRHSS